MSNTRSRVICLWAISLVLLFQRHDPVNAFAANKESKNGVNLSQQNKQQQPPPPMLNLKNNDDITSTAEDEEGEEPSDLSRRAVFDWPFVAVGSAIVTGELLSTALGGLSLSRPPAHEQRVADTVRRALTEAAETTSSSVLRVLEVGIGSDLRLIRRGLYNQGIDKLASLSSRSSNNKRELQITGIDVQNLPKAETLKDAQLFLDQLSAQNGGVKASLKIQQGDIASKLPFDDGTFDVVICCLTLCSVEDPKAAIQEIQRLIRPSGGTFGYVEHVAVNPDEPYRFLEWQQTTLDPLQQLVAENCHLHRYTQENINQIFQVESNKATTIQQDRFLVDKMWPVSSQCCGVIQRKLA